MSTDSISFCVELLAEFGDKALQPSYDPWASVDFHGRAKIHVDLTKAFKDVRTLGLKWSQCPEFDHSIYALKVVVLMGQKWGEFPGFDHRFIRGNKNVGR